MNYICFSIDLPLSGRKLPRSLLPGGSNELDVDEWEQYAVTEGPPQVPSGGSS